MNGLLDSETVKGLLEDIRTLKEQVTNLEDAIVKQRTAEVTELARQAADAEYKLRQTNLRWHERYEELEKKYLTKLVDGIFLEAENVEWVVNDIGELGVKIGDQFFFLYKARSLVYKGGQHDDGRPMKWRHVYKREFGECCHPPPKTEYSRDRGVMNPDGSYTFGPAEHWQDLPPQRTKP